MQHVLNLSQPISFAPGTVAAEVLQNVRTILATRKGTVPLDRDFGLEWEHVDKPSSSKLRLLRLLSDGNPEL